MDQLSWHAEGFSRSPLLQFGRFGLWSGCGERVPRICKSVRPSVPGTNRTTQRLNPGSVVRGSDELGGENVPDGAWRAARSRRTPVHGTHCYLAGTVFFLMIRRPPRCPLFPYTAQRPI